MKRLRAFASAAPLRFAEALAAATNEIARRSPAPKELPYFGLDHPIGVGTALLDRLSELGIFRYYERVLDLDGGVGGPARWLARRRGCEVVTLARSRPHAAAGALLIARAHLRSEVARAAGAFDAVPAADASFTHAWSIEGIPSGETMQRCFAELARVVRPGGHVALQDWMRPRDGGEGDAPSVPRVVEGLRAAGFREVRALNGGALLEPESTLAGIVRTRALELLGHPLADERGGVSSAFLALEAREQAAARGELRLTQVFAQRPA